MAGNDGDKQQSRVLLDEKTGFLAPSSVSPSPILNEDFSSVLLSEEHLDRSSPELWPEQIPGVTKFASLSVYDSIEDKPDKPYEKQPEWLKDFDRDDISVLHGFGSLTASALFEKARDLQNLAFQLGLEEAKEMTRGRFLGILPKKKDIRT